MENLKQLTWIVVKKNIKEEKKKKTFDDSRKEIRHGKTKKNDKPRQVEKIAEEVGWIIAITLQ